MANIKFSQFTTQTDPANVQFVVGFNGTTNVKIAPGNIGGGGASDLNGLTDCLVNAQFNQLIGNVPSNIDVNAIENTSLGNDALNSITTGDTNVAIGNDSLSGVTTASNNTAVGSSALQFTTATGSTALGFQAGGLTSSGTFSVYVGYQAARSNTAQGHISIGEEAGYSQTSGVNNTNVGYQAGHSNTTGENNTMLGFNAGFYSTGSFNTFIGYRVAYGSSGNTTGERNVAIGDVALTALQGGGRNVSIGTNSGQAITSGGENVIIGDFAGSTLTTGADNIIIGQNAQSSSASVSNEITLGAANITLLRIPGLGTTDGHVLTFETASGGIVLKAAGGGGASSLNGLTDCLVDTDSLYVGEVPAGLSGNPQGNAVLGIDAGNALTTGSNNVAIGFEALLVQTDGEKNVAIGAGALKASTSEGRNTAVGFEALKAMNQLFNPHNTAVGYQADATATDSFHRTSIGALTGGNSTGSNITNIGYGAQESGSTVSNEITLGNSSVATLRCAVTSITSISDERDKTEIKDLGYGLAFIDALQPREFVWDNRAETNADGEEFYSSNKGKKDFGFIAQEVKELDNDTLRLVYDENPDKLELSYGKLVPVLVQAIKELKEEIELLKQ